MLIKTKKKGLKHAQIKIIQVLLINNMKSLFILLTIIREITFNYLFRCILHACYLNNQGITTIKLVSNNEKLNYHFYYYFHL
jgi:hypothetical protein